MDIPEYTFKEVGYSGSLQDIANILEYPQEQVLFSGSISITEESCVHTLKYSLFQYHVNNLIHMASSSV